MDSSNERASLSEICFDDLLDVAPVNKNGESLIEGDPLELCEETKTKSDNGVNTLGPKKTSLEKSIITTSAPAMRREGISNVAQSAPVVLNSKNILPKMSMPLINNIIKVTPKNSALISANHTNTSNLTVANAANIGQVKTAYKASGQKIFIQKASTTPTNTLTAVKLQSPGTNNPMVLKTVTSPIANATKTVGNVNKAVLQMVRTSNGSFVQVRPTITGKNSTLTFSPASIAGKKIISTQGKVFIKAPVKSLTTLSSAEPTATTTSNVNVLSGSRTLLKSSVGENVANKSKTIVVQSAGGKQIIVSNHNLIKFSPKTQSITTMAANVSTTSTNSSPKVTGHTIQLPGQQRLQYVRVLSDTKLTPKSVQSTTATTTTTNAAFAAVTAVNSKADSSNGVGSTQKTKILNSLPQHFKVQRAACNKLVVTQPTLKPSTTTSTFSPVASKVQKTIVTAPTLRPISNDKVKTALTLIRNGSSVGPSPAALVGKHKISDSTESELTDNTSGPPDSKKLALSKRLIVIPKSVQRILNNGMQIQQIQGRISTQMVLTTKAITQSSTTSPITSSGTNVNVTSNTKNLYSVLKPQTTQSQLYSVLKSNNANNPATTTTSTPLTAVNKPITFNAQQHEKLQELKKALVPLHSSSNSSTVTSSESTFLAVKIKEEPLDTAAIQAKFNIIPLPLNSNPSLSEDTKDKEEVLVGGIRRKHCNCSKSQCLKLYCDCFANGEFCQNCTCKDCYNNLEYEDERQHAIRNCLGRNPSAFKPKIIAARDQGDMRLHNKGCNCKRSGCLKNYCECYEAKIPCSSNCKCVGCRNIEDRPDLDMDPIDPKIMVSIANATNQIPPNGAVQKRTYERVHLNNMISVKTERVIKENVKTNSNGGSELLAASSNMSPSLEKQQCNFITQEVIDATIQCMITQADECEKNGLPAYQTEKMVMEELGRCLVEIIDFSIRNTDNSFAQD